METDKYQKELERYRAEQALYERAVGGDVDAQILWLTSRRPDEWKWKPEHGMQEDRLDSN